MSFTAFSVLIFSALITFTSHANELGIKRINDFEHGMMATDLPIDTVLNMESGWDPVTTCAPGVDQSCWFKLSISSDNLHYDHLIWKTLSSRSGKLFFINQNDKVVGSFLFDFYRSLRLTQDLDYRYIVVKFPKGKKINAIALLADEQKITGIRTVKDGIILALFLLAITISTTYMYFVWHIKRLKTLFVTCYILFFTMFYIYKFGFLWDGYDSKGSYIISFLRSDYWYTSYSMSLVFLYLMYVCTSKVNFKNFIFCVSLVFLQAFSIYISFEAYICYLISTLLAGMIVFFFLRSKELTNKKQFLVSYISSFIFSIAVLESSMNESLISGYFHVIQVLFFLSHISFVLFCVNDLGNLRVVNIGDYKKLLSSSDLDFMTGLYNRKAIGYKENRENPHRYYYIDANKLKFLNDSQGHHVGDRMLINLAMRFNTIAQKGNGRAYRVGGDEFVLITATSVSKELLEYLAEQNIKQETANALSFSFGRYCSEPNELVEDCIYKAEYCCRKAKSSKQPYQDWRLQDGIMLYSLPNLREEAIELVNSNQLLCFAQKIHSVKDTPSTYELLCRLKIKDESGNDKIVSAGEVLDVVASHGLERELDSRMLTHAVSLLERYSSIQLSLNFSVKTIFDRNVIYRLCDLPLYIRSRLSIEVTEQVFYRADEKFRKIVKELQNHKITVALDDFGSGYSSYSILSGDCFDTIKLDGSLVENINSSEFKKKMVSSLVELAAISQTKVVAERVETVEELRTLEALGIDFIQGFYIHKPTLAIEVFDNMEKEARESVKVERNLVCGLTS